jgi:O-antigen/teichoic acid export membrane protein
MLKNIIENWFQKTGLYKIISAKTFVSLSTLFTGTLFSTIIPILFAPVMTRIFTTSDYGVLGLYMSISGLIGVLAYVHYPQAIILSKDDEEARQAMWFSIGFSAMIALLSFIVIAVLYFLLNDFKHTSLRFWLLLIPLSVILNGITSSMMVWANRHQQYKILASNRIIQAVLTVVIQISFGLLINNETGLLLGLLGGQAISAFLLWFRFRNNETASLNLPQPATFRGIAYQYRKLLIYSTPSEFINNLINQTPIFLLQKFGGIAYVGSYNFTQRLLGMPQLFLSSAIVEVFKQKASVAYNTTGNCRGVFIKTFKALGLLAILPFSLIILFSPPVFAFVFGEEWRMAGEFARFLGILFFFRFIVSPLTFTYFIVGRLKEDFWLHILFLLVTTLSFYIGNIFIDDKKYLILVYAVSYTGVYLIYFFRSFYFSKGV